MAYFEPTSTIYFHSGTGVDAHNKPYFEDNFAMHAYFAGFKKFVVENYSYQRADERQYVAVEHSYYDCMKCDYITFNNGSGYGPTWIICRITGVEWKNPNCCWVWFEVDPFCTFCGDIAWSKSYCFVEREHVTKDWDGTSPIWEACGLPEDFGIDPEYCVASVKKMWTPNRYVIISPYDENGNPHFTGQAPYGIYDGLSMIVKSSPAEVNSYLDAVANSDKGDINQIVGIYSVPNDFIGVDGALDVNLTPPWGQLIYHNAKVWTSQFSTISIVACDGTSVDLKPELFPLKQYRFKAQGYFVGGSMGFRVTPQGYALHSDTDVDIGLLFSGVPQGAFVGNSYAQWVSANQTAILSRTIRGIASAGVALGTAGAMAATGPLGIAIAGSQAANALQDIGGVLGDMHAARKHSATVDGNCGCSDLNIATAVQGYGFHIRWYQGRDTVMRRIDNYFDRFGYKVGQLKIPNRSTRPFWNYVKTVDAHISATCAETYIRGIEQMLDSGVTFWKTAACAIGDYSNPEGNKAGG